MTELTVRLSRKRVTAFLLLVVTVLLINHVMLQTMHYQWQRGHYLVRWFFDVDEEDSLPTWYSSAALLFSSGLLYLIADEKRRAGARFVRHWQVLCAGFLFLSMDEVAGVHESINTAMDEAEWEGKWTVPAAGLVLVVALSYLQFLVHLPRRTAMQFVIAGAIFVGGAVGVEHATDSYLEIYEMDTLGYNLLTALEEGLEMLGVVVFVDALLGYGGRAMGEE